MAGNLGAILAFLEGKGLTPAQAAGVAGNLQVESGLDPAKPNPREGAIGIAQWEGGRRTQLDAYAARTGGTEQDLTTQLGFLWSELQGSESNALHKLLATNDPASAAASFDQYYERSSGAARSQRVAAAQSIFTGSPTAAAGGGSTTTGGVQTAGLMSSMLPASWSTDLLSIGLKVGAGCIAGALVVVGMSQATKGSSS